MMDQFRYFTGWSGIPKYAVGDIVYDEYVRLHGLIQDITAGKYEYMILENGKKHKATIDHMDLMKTIRKVA